MLLVHDLLTGKISCILQIEERINIDTLEELKKRFAEADVNKNGKLELEEFKALMKAKLAVSGNRVSIMCMVMTWPGVLLIVLLMAWIVVYNQI